MSKNPIAFRARYLWQEARPLWRQYQWLRGFLGSSAGFFVEAGANDGFEQSTTSYLQKFGGWSGLLIEPLPGKAEACRRNRPGCAVEQAALVPPSHTDPTVTLHDYNLMSYVPGALGVADIAEREQADGYTGQALEVPARTLSAVLDKYRVPTIDFLSLDVEGYEAPVLQGLDFRRWQPTHILVEARHREAVDTILLPRYKAIAQRGDYDVLYKYRRIG